MKFPNFLSIPDCVVGIPVLRAIFCFSLEIPKALFSENVSPGAKNGADCYSKNGDAVTVLTWQS